jgi:hypothetical protein
MENNENFVTEEVTENVETTTEQTPKTYTQEEVDAIVGKRLARSEAKVRKEYERKYGDLENVLKAGTGKEKVEDMTSTFREFYAKKGIQIPTKPTYSDEDEKILAKHEAEELISGGDEDVRAELNRLTDMGVSRMTAREKALYPHLVEHMNGKRTKEALAKLGVTDDEINSEDFKSFRKKFNSDVPVEDVYNIFQKTKPKKEIRTMGSLKHTQTAPKDFYTQEEIERLTMEDLDDPKVWEAVRRSMTG